MSSLGQQLLDAKLAGTTIPDLVEGQSSVHRYRFRSNEQAADVALSVFVAYLRERAETHRRIASKIHSIPELDRSLILDEEADRLEAGT